jgi:hypothetical protein
MPSLQTTIWTSRACAVFTRGPSGCPAISFTTRWAAASIGYDPGLAVGEDTTIALALDDNYRGRFVEDALTVYQEDADVNLEKAIACNVSQLKQLSDMRERRLLRSGALQYAARRALWRVKLAILQAMRICPRLYNRAMVGLRSYGRTTGDYRLGAERIAFIDKFRGPPG